MSRRFTETLAGAAVRQDVIAAVLGVTVPTLRKHYRAELDRGAARLEAKLILGLHKIAGGRNAALALKSTIFLLRCRFGWSEYAPPPR